MFQDALVESSGKLQSKSKHWLPLTLLLNLAIVATAILIPLLHPEALPKTALTATLTVPPPPPPAAASQPKTAAQPTHAAARLNAMQAPTHSPHQIGKDADPPLEPATNAVVGSMPGNREAAASGILTALGPTTTPIVVTHAAPKPHTERIAISSGVAAGAILNKTTPLYPAIAKAAHVSGAVLLHAVISKTGAIESLQVVAGPEMLRASALDAVRQWRYRPYLLNGEPTEVETSITVNFNFGT